MENKYAYSVIAATVSMHSYIHDLQVQTWQQPQVLQMGRVQSLL